MQAVVALREAAHKRDGLGVGVGLVGDTIGSRKVLVLADVELNRIVGRAESDPAVPDGRDEIAARCTDAGGHCAEVDCRSLVAVLADFRRDCLVDSVFDDDCAFRRCERDVGRVARRFSQRALQDDDVFSRVIGDNVVARRLHEDIRAVAALERVVECAARDCVCDFAARDCRADVVRTLEVEADRRLVAGEA